MEGRREGEGPWGKVAKIEVVEANDREGVALRGGAWGEEKGRGRQWRREFSGRKRDGRKLRTRRRGRELGGGEAKEEADRDKALQRAGVETKTENKEMIAKRVVRTRVERAVCQGGGLNGRMPSTWC